MKFCALGLFVLILISGCTNGIGNIDVTNAAKLLPVAQEFLNEHSNEQIRTAYWSESAVNRSINTIREMCGEQMEIPNYWKVEFSDNN